jgi:hypothetical protein
LRIIGELRVNTALRFKILSEPGTRCDRINTARRNFPVVEANKNAQTFETAGNADDETYAFVAQLVIVYMYRLTFYQIKLFRKIFWWNADDWSSKCTVNAAFYQIVYTNTQTACFYYLSQLNMNPCIPIFLRLRQIMLLDREQVADFCC